MNYQYKQLEEEKVFKDPVHRYVRVTDQVIWDLIATPEFQRLRRIKQLGTTYMTFHGAEHSRFNHSLGVYEIVRRMINKFERYDEWNKEERLLCLCAALLHDLGHGPFSHSFENLFQLNHEAFTEKIIVGNTQINRVLERVEIGFSKKVAEVIALTYEDKLVVSLISSQIDADRMDYLLRDAYYAGVSYGLFDMERILRVMRPTKEEVVIKSTGMHAVEDYIMSRYQMYWQVYFHPVTRSAEVILSKILQRVKLLSEMDFPFNLKPTHFIPFFDNNISLENYLQLDETIVHYYFQAWQQEDDYILRDLCERFTNRRLFKYIEFDPDQQKDELTKLKQLFERVGIDPGYYLAIDKSSDLPYDFYESVEEDRVPINLQMPNKELVELSRQSDIVEAISRKKQTDHKLYFPLELINNLPDGHNKKQILSILNIN